MLASINATGDGVLTTFLRARLDITSVNANRGRAEEALFNCRISVRDLNQLKVRGNSKLASDSLNERLRLPVIGAVLEVQDLNARVSHPMDGLTPGHQVVRVRQRKPIAGPSGPYA